MAKQGRTGARAASSAEPVYQGSLFSAEVTSPEPADGPVAPGTGEHVAGIPAARPQVIVVDGHSLAYRNYFGMRELSTSTGIPTHAVYGFLRTILSFLSASDDEDACVVAFDAALRTGPGAKRLYDGRSYLHAARRPLDEVDLSTAEDRGQGTLFDSDCTGMCGV